MGTRDMTVVPAELKLAGETAIQTFPRRWVTLTCWKRNGTGHSEKSSMQFQSSLSIGPTNKALRWGQRQKGRPACEGNSLLWGAEQSGYVWTWWDADPSPAVAQRVEQERKNQSLQTTEAMKMIQIRSDIDGNEQECRMQAGFQYWSKERTGRALRRISISRPSNLPGSLELCVLFPFVGNSLPLNPSKKRDRTS